MIIISTIWYNRDNILNPQTELQGFLFIFLLHEKYNSNKLWRTRTPLKSCLIYGTYMDFKKLLCESVQSVQ